MSMIPRILHDMGLPFAFTGKNGLASDLLSVSNKSTAYIICPEESARDEIDGIVAAGFACGVLVQDMDTSLIWFGEEPSRELRDHIRSSVFEGEDSIFKKNGIIDNAKALIKAQNILDPNEHLTAAYDALKRYQTCVLTQNLEKVGLSPENLTERKPNMRQH